MKVRLVQQISGTRNGQEWPAPGNEVDLPDVEARGLLASGAATEAGHQSDKVLVPPAGVHTPGTVAQGVGGVALVEAPADAVSDPEAARAAHEARLSGDYLEGTGAHAHQKSTGAALTKEQTDQADQAAEVAAKDLADMSAPKVGESKKTTAKAAADKS